MHKKEIRRLAARTQQDGLTIVPLSFYFKGSLVKAELGLCKGKKLYDKRESDAKRSADREIQRTLREKNSCSGECCAASEHSGRMRQPGRRA